MHRLLTYLNLKISYLYIEHMLMFCFSILICLSLVSSNLAAMSGRRTAVVLLSEGAEELETVAVVDILRRAEIEVTLASTTGNVEPIKCSRGVVIKPDDIFDAIKVNLFDVVVLPGGLKGAEFLANSTEVGKFLKLHEENGKLIAAICAAPIALKSHRIAEKHQITSHPVVANEFLGSAMYTYSEKMVVHDRNLVTSRGPGTAIAFALRLVSILISEKHRQNRTRLKAAASRQCRRPWRKVPTSRHCMDNRLTAANNDRQMSVGARLIRQFIDKLRARDATVDRIRSAEALVRGVHFRDYEERSSCRLMQFSHARADEVIDRFCDENGWDESSRNDLKFSAHMLDADQKSDTFIRFQKVGESEFFVHFIALKRIEETIFFGLARHHVKFKLSPNVKVTERNTWIYKNWWNKMRRNRNQPPTPEPEFEEETVPAEDMTLLENFFLLRALKKFAEDIPSSVNELQHEERQFLTMGSDYDF
ncbi:Protein DJ-1 [Trichinella spiralis]|uniref:D-lactate dehydratase n=1 Tax=Trichinella spiralis TaxID=6334 RepID=A0A0V1AQ63_TRISP|nr:Protein DJ-1 [Trichinella spiralis]KRY26936.1 Protein DJ-1 [Trichinella spiralis]